MLAALTRCDPIVCFAGPVCVYAAGHNVLVAAHTSAGKTVVAEYAFAMGIRCVSVVVEWRWCTAGDVTSLQLLHAWF